MNLNRRRILKTAGGALLTGTVAHRVLADEPEPQNLEMHLTLIWSNRAYELKNPIFVGNLWEALIPLDPAPDGSARGIWIAAGTLKPDTEPNQYRFEFVAHLIQGDKSHVKARMEVPGISVGKALTPRLPVAEMIKIKLVRAQEPAST